MVKQELIAARLERLREYIKILKAILQVLADEKVISMKLLRELEVMAAFRNVLVHDYLRIDRDKVYFILKEKLPSLEKLGLLFGKLI